MIETYTKGTKVGKIWQFFLQNQGTAAATSSGLRSLLPKTVQLANDRGKRVQECSSPRGRGKDSLPEWVGAGPCCLPHRTRKASSSPSFDRSLRWFAVLLTLLSHFLVARATRNCRYSCPVQRYWLNKACTAAARSACMHVHNSSSIERRPQFGSLTRSWIWIRALRMAFSSSFEFGYVVFGLFFPSPTRFRPDKYVYDVWQ